MAVKDGDHLQGFCLWPVDDEVGIGWEEFDRLVRQVLVPVSGARRSCQENNLVADDGFHAIGYGNAALLLEVAPDLDEIERGLGREDVARAHSSLVFNSAR